MKKRKARYENKWIRAMVIGAFSVLMMISMVVAFAVNFNRIYGLLLEKDMEQVRFTSGFVTKLISTEIENLQSALDSSQRVFQQTDNNHNQRTINYLNDIRKEFGFEKVGIANLEGHSLDNNGKIEILKNEEMFDEIKYGKKYISNDIDYLDTMLIAVPFYKDNKVDGVIWGYYSITSISKKIELYEKSHRYFQIIDNTGLYISDSGNVNSFAEDMNMWKELERYAISDGVTVDDIRATVESGKAGEFYFSYKGKGRYVTYEPLGINNWYVFSVLVEEYLGGYVSKIENIFFSMLWGIIGGLLLLAAMIVCYILLDMREVKKHNEELSLKNALLFMVMKHTRDIPFEINFQDDTVSLYSNADAEKILVRKTNYFTPENMLAEGRIAAEDYLLYQNLFRDLTQRKKINPLVLKLNIEGKWDYNKIHIKTVNENRIIGFLEDYNQQVLQEQQMEEIRTKSRTDSLTGLYNREYFSMECTRCINAKKFSSDALISALFLLDLDHFKKANDTLGHMMGDQILKESAAHIKSVIRDTDLAGRLGGDEFVVYIQNVKDMAALELCAEKILRVLRHTYGTDSLHVEISASMGIATCKEGTSFNELYKLADKALYEAKDKGRDTYHISIEKDNR